MSMLLCEAQHWRWTKGLPASVVFAAAAYAAYAAYAAAAAAYGCFLSVSSGCANVLLWLTIAHLTLSPAGCDGAMSCYASCVGA
jgi:hypothetical protein